MRNEKPIAWPKIRKWIPLLHFCTGTILSLFKPLVERSPSPFRFFFIEFYWTETCLNLLLESKSNNDKRKFIFLLLQNSMAFRELNTEYKLEHSNWHQYFRDMKHGCVAMFVKLVHHFSLVYATCSKFISCSDKCSSVSHIFNSIIGILQFFSPLSSMRELLFIPMIVRHENEKWNCVCYGTSID